MSERCERTDELVHYTPFPLSFTFWVGAAEHEFGAFDHGEELPIGRRRRRRQRIGVRKRSRKEEEEDEEERDEKRRKSP